MRATKAQIGLHARPVWKKSPIYTELLFEELNVRSDYENVHADLDLRCSTTNIRLFKYIENLTSKNWKILR